uniref:Ig-like domain-containing protein n=1 Tax=Lates calcarifer TaxID=8187 RepID=A0A4W6FGE4_LATCA
VWFVSLLCLVNWCFRVTEVTHVRSLIRPPGPGVVTVAVAEGSEAVLPCSLSTRQNIEQKVFDWKKDVKKEVFLYAAGQHYNKGRTGQDEQFKGRVFHFEDELKNGNASIKIHNTKMADSGSYTCTFPNTAEPESHVKLVVGEFETDVTLKVIIVFLHFHCF